MAAVDRRVPNLDDFVGLNWGCWVDRVDTEPPDAQSEDTKSGRACCETMTLRKEDMPIYGHCPALDDFYLVVCGHCGKVVKPAAFEEHCDRRHRSLVKASSPSDSAPVLLSTSRPSSSNVPKERQEDSGRGKEASVASSGPQRRTNKPQKETVSLPTVAKASQDKSQPASPQRPRSHPTPSAPSVPNLCRASSTSSSSVPSSSVSIRLSPLKTPLQKPTAAQTSSGPQRDTRTCSRAPKNTKAPITNRKCEDQDKKKLSAMTQKVKPESDLPRVSSSPQHSEPSPAKTKAAESQLGPKEVPSSRCSKFALNTNSHVVRSKDVSETFAEEESAVEVEVQPPYPFNQSLPLSDDSDSEEQCSHLTTTAWHPKPLGICTFGCRAFGCSVFTFDRRLHHLRIALSAMLDKHVNSHLWKKMPQPASSLRSPSARGPPVRPRTGPNQTGSVSAKSTSLDRLKNTHNNCRRTKSPSPAQTLSSAVSQQCISVGQTTKAHVGQRELIQNTKAVQKNNTSSKNIAPANAHVSGSLFKKTPPLSPLRPSERNTPALKESLPSKTCPPRNKGRPPPLVQSKAGSCDDRALVQKRKPQPTSVPSSSSPSKKCPRLSPPSRSSLFSWRRDSSQDVWLGVWRKEHTAEEDAPGQY